MLVITGNEPLQGGLIAAALALVCLAPGCAPEAATASEAAERGEVPMVSRRGPFQRVLLLTGELEAVNSVKITVPRTPVWRLPIRWLEQDGVSVVEGQRVLELENSQFTGELAQKRLARLGAYNDLRRKEADIAGSIAEKEFALASARIARDKAKLKAEIPEDLRSRREYQEDQLNLTRAEYALRKAEEDLATTRRAADAEVEELRVEYERATDEIETAEKAIADLTLSAPRDGLFVVSENRDEGRKYQVGDNVWVGLTVAQIPDLSTMKVVARLSDVDDGLIAVGMRARCALDTYPDTIYTGTIAEVAPVAQEDDDQSLRRSFRVDVRLAEADPNKMRPGMSVKVEILPEPVEDVLLVPRVTVDLESDPVAVLLVGGSRREVRLGPCNAMQCVVEDGLEAGVGLEALQ